MTRHRWRHAVPILLALAVGGCGKPSSDAGRAATNRADTMALDASSGGGSAVEAPTTPATPIEPAPSHGVALPRAEPAPSALFNAGYQRVESDWVPILFLCDGVGGDRVKLVTTPDAKGLSTLWTYRKPDFRTVSEAVRIGDNDPGAGQIMREIRRPDGGVFGNVHSVNPGMLGDAEATTLPTLSSITDRNETTRCRWAPRGRVLLVDARRSVLVTADKNGGYTYRSFDYAHPGKVIDARGGATNVATTTVSGGRLVPADPGHEVYEFRKGPWTYRVTASADNTAPGASLTVLREGSPVQTSIAAAYEMAAKRIE